MTDRDSTTRTRARTPGEEDHPPSTAVHWGVTDPTESGTFGDTNAMHEGRKQTKAWPALCREQGRAERRVGKAPSEMPSFQPYWGKPAVRNDRGDRGDVGIIRSPVRASILPDFGVAEEIETSEGAAVDGTRLGGTVERSDAGGEVVETGEVFAVAAVAPEQDVREGGEAVDVLFDGSKGVACWALLMFYLAVVLEGGDVVGGGLDAQDEGEFVVDLDRGFAETMLDAGA